ncbi:aromatic-ring-hydroxylating dioxygenase subunit beta [Aurantiacibacter atlanticus]|nr:aromatic-ring-hydroxylating dioxygenase subunit beta [Aurantiacibacter atlanticus]
MTNQRQAVGMELHHAISSHYVMEARLLQDLQYREWFDTVIAEDIHYWMPIFEQRYVRDRRAEPTPNDAAIFNDNYEELSQRVDRLLTGQVWMEDPPSRIRYFVTNVEAYETAPDEFEVFSNVLVHRNRRQTEVYVHTLGREDKMRKTDEGFKVFSRKIIHDARVVQDKNLYFFA